MVGGEYIGVGCHVPLQCMKVKNEGEVTQSCLTLSDPMDRNLPGSSIHGIFQARILEWGAIAFSAMECYSVIKKNQTGSFVEMRMDQSWGCQTAWISQKKKNKYHILMHICGIWKKNGTDDFTCKTETQMKRTDVWILRGKGEWDELRGWDWHIYTIDTMYKIDNELEPIVCNTRTSTQCSVVT